MHESKAIATDNKSLSIYEGLVNSAFIMSDFDTDSVSRETVCFDNEIRQIEELMQAISEQQDRCRLLQKEILQYQNDHKHFRQRVENFITLEQQKMKGKQKEAKSVTLHKTSNIIGSAKQYLNICEAGGTKIGSKRIR